MVLRGSSTAEDFSLISASTDNDLLRVCDDNR